MPPVTLNIDLGELPGEPEELYGLATQANVACGGHAGDEASMRRACRLARTHGTAIAAHPSYPDRAGFGRTRMAIAPEMLRSSIAAQCRALRDVAAAEGSTVSRVKPHGALYHDVVDDEVLAEALVAGVRDAFGEGSPMVFIGRPGSALERAVERMHAGTVIAEGFADRTYDGAPGPNAKLRPRTHEGALITEVDAAAAQALALARSGAFGTICVHGDTPGAVAIARRVRAVLETDGLLR
jgi:UPF0271 protein